MLKGLGFVILMLAGSAPAFANCPTELRQSDSYRELSAILKCLSDQNRALSDRVNRLERGAAAPASRRDPRTGAGQSEPAAAPASDLTSITRGVVKFTAGPCRQPREELLCSLTMEHTNKSASWQELRMSIEGSFAEDADAAEAALQRIGPVAGAHRIELLSGTTQTLTLRFQALPQTLGVVPKLTLSLKINGAAQFLEFQNVAMAN